MEMFWNRVVSVWANKIRIKFNYHLIVFDVWTRLMNVNLRIIVADHNGDDSGYFVHGSSRLRSRADSLNWKISVIFPYYLG